MADTPTSVESALPPTVASPIFAGSGAPATHNPAATFTGLHFRAADGVGLAAPDLRTSDQPMPRRKVYLMGILNATPDSFFDKGRYFGLDTTLRRGLELVAEGADIIEVGGQSARPGELISVDEEIARIVPVIERLRGETDRPMAVDTFRVEVAAAAVAAGVTIINDIGGLPTPEMAELAARTGAYLVIMHIKGQPKVRQLNPQYNDVVGEMLDYMRERTQRALDAGVPRTRIIIDPGLGFAKAPQHDLQVMNRLADLRALGFTMLLATSRKNYIGDVLNLSVEDLLEGTIAANCWGVTHGADILRVHDLRAVARAVRLTEAFLEPLTPDQIPGRPDKVRP